MLSFVSTSLLDSQAQTVVNTVNTVGVMGKGLAKHFRERYPDMFTSYKSFCERGLLQVGKLWLWKGPDQWVLNFPTKKHWRDPSRLEYVDAGLRKFVATYEEKGISEISFPRLGCGNGGLAWEDVRRLMEQHLAQLPIAVFIHDYEVDIGAPEHKTKSEIQPYLLSFDTFVSDLIDTINTRQGRFRTISNQSDFLVRIGEAQDLFIVRKGRTTEALVSREELLEAWTMLRRGPLTHRRLVGRARDEASYVLGLLATLPYARAISLRDAESDTPLNGVELLDKSTQVAEISEQH